MKVKNLILSGLAIVSAALLMSLSPGDKIMTKNSDGTYVINTTTLCDSKGFKGTTPLQVFIKKGKVVKIEALKNNETPGYFAKVTKFLLPLYSNTPLNKAKKLSKENKIDGCSGATFSTRAVQSNIEKALEYYEKHK